MLSYTESCRGRVARRNETRRTSAVPNESGHLADNPTSLPRSLRRALETAIRLQTNLTAVDEVPNSGFHCRRTVLLQGIDEFAHLSGIVAEFAKDGLLDFLQLIGNSRRVW